MLLSFFSRASLFDGLQSIHLFMLREAGWLTHAGLQPNHFPQYSQRKQYQKATPTLASTFDGPHPPSITLTSPSSQGVPSEKDNTPSAFECLMEKVSNLSCELDRGEGEDRGGRSLNLPYVGPRTFQQFLECFCEIFRQKRTETAAEQKNLTMALEALRTTQEDADVTRETLCQLKQEHKRACELSQQLLAELTSKACQLERLKALLGEPTVPIVIKRGL